MINAGTPERVGDTFVYLGIDDRGLQLEIVAVADDRRIGGLAVIHYGYPRDTGDLDLLVLADRREQWLAVFGELQYAVSQDKNTFIQLSPPTVGAWPVDLMLVREATFHEET